MNTSFFKLLLTVLLLSSAVEAAMANDGSFYSNGNHLVPLQENDIAVSKEVLTIDIGDDGFARVDVYYEFYNRGAAKTIDMGFEAAVPYNSGEPLSVKGIHPHIHDFTATLNGKKLPCRNALVAVPYDGSGTDFVPLDLRKWKIPADWDEDDVSALYNSELDSTVSIAYAYYFNADFAEGLNKVHHTYRYQMSEGVGRTFEIPYWLTPAMRWANHQIDDFTLRITATKTAKHFFIQDSLFLAAPFKIVGGEGKVRTNANDSWGHYTEAVVRNGVVEWHAKNFKPTENLTICSADMLYFGIGDVASFYDRAANYYPWTWTMNSFNGRTITNNGERIKLIQRILRNLPYAHRGYVFKDQNLQKYFDSKWWYMPDPTWKASTESFTKRDMFVVNELGKDVPEWF